MIRVGIIGAAGYTAGELIRILLNHPDAVLVAAESRSHAGQPLHAAHPDLLGETDLCFTEALDPAEVAEGVGIIYRAGFGYKQLSMEMTKNFPRPEFYNKMFEKWGLDTGPLWRK